MKKTNKIDLNNTFLQEKDLEYYVENKNYILTEVSPTLAREIITTYHYSGKVVKNSKLHLGVFDKKTKKIVGALQFGYPMSANKTPNLIVTGSSIYDMMELNRMAMFDTAPKFSESQAISLSIKYLKRYKKEIKWILSYSDGKEGNVGIIYQATNWKYLGCLVSQTFHKLDGEIIHNISIYHRHKTRKIEYLNSVYNDVSKIISKQHIYVYPLQDDIKFNLEEKPYPRKETEPRILKEFIYKENGVILDSKRIIDYTKNITDCSIDNAVIKCGGTE